MKRSVLVCTLTVLLAIPIPIFGLAGATTSLAARPNPPTVTEPTLVHSKSLSATNEFGNDFNIQYTGAMGTGTLGKNLLTLSMTYPDGSTVSSITDNEFSTYQLGASVDSGSWITELYYVPGTAAGITQITVTFADSVADWHASVEEYAGVAVTFPADGACMSSTAAPPTVECDSPIVTTANNDLIIASGTLVGGLDANLCGNTSSSIVPRGGFILNAADPYCSDFDEELVQKTAGSIRPSVSIGGNQDNFNFVAMAFRAANAGTLATGMNIVHQQTVQIDGGASSQFNYFVSTGNLLVVSVDDGNTNDGGNVVTIDTCTPTNTWTKRTPEGLNAPQMFFIASPSVSSNLKCKVHSGMPSNTTLMVIYDIAGADPNPEDTISLYTSSTGTMVSEPSLTPTYYTGIAFAVENTGNGPSTAVGNGFLYDNTPYLLETDAGKLNNGDGWQHVFYTTPNPIEFSWTQTDDSSCLQGFAIAFKAAAQ